MGETDVRWNQPRDSEGRTQRSRQDLVSPVTPPTETSHIDSLNTCRRKRRHPFAFAMPATRSRLGGGRALDSTKRGHEVYQNQNWCGTSYRSVLFCVAMLWASSATIKAVQAEEWEHKLRAAVPSGSSGVHTRRSSDTSEHHQSTQEELFAKWCHDMLGVESLLEIQHFEYYDYMQAMKDRVDVFCEDCAGPNDPYDIFNENIDTIDDDEQAWWNNPDHLLSVRDYPTISVRGLAASQAISIGQVILQIPRSSLWTLENCIDGDPVLGNVIGAEARKRHGWDTPFDEIPLLAVALLYHIGLGEDSPYKPYIAVLEGSNNEQEVDRIPHLWDSHRLRTSATIGVRRVAKGIQKDVRDLYDTIVGELVEEHPHIFGNPFSPDRLREEEDFEDEEDFDDDGLAHNEEWLFSLARFHWAFAVINARHWHLQLPHAEEEAESEEAAQTDVAQVSLAAPPATMPTDEWLDLQRAEQRKEEEESLRESEQNDNFKDELWPSGNSFLAPMADLLNFGPPCTRGVYNKTTESFDIVATCEFQKGQEVTFWYADACQDDIVANYGFTHPMMVPPCIDHRLIALQHDFRNALDDLDLLDQELDRVLQAMEKCDCTLPQGEGAMGGHGIGKQDGSIGNGTMKDGKTMKLSLPRTPSPPKSIEPLPQPTQPGDARHAIRGSERRMSPKGVDRLARGPVRQQRGASRKSDL